MLNIATQPTNAQNDFCPIVLQYHTAIWYTQYLLNSHPFRNPKYCPKSEQTIFFFSKQYLLVQVFSNNKCLFQWKIL